MKTLVTLTGPSCGGKTTLETELKKHGFKAAISTTTRPMRDGEVNGGSYYFVTPETFGMAVSAGHFVESVIFNGNRYGVEAAELNRVFDTGAPVVLIVEPHGLEQIHFWGTRNPDVNILSIFVDCPPAVIAERFLNRFTADFALSISKGGKEMDKVVKTYKDRLAVAMGEETTWWSKSQRWCSVNLEEFNESNTQATVGMIKKLTVSAP